MLFSLHLLVQVSENKQSFSGIFFYFKMNGKLIQWLKKKNRYFYQKVTSSLILIIIFLSKNYHWFFYRKIPKNENFVSFK